MNCQRVLGFLWQSATLTVEHRLALRRVTFIDTSVEFGFYAELVESASGFLKQLQAISDICAHWDGNDRVRLLTRDGGRVPEQWATPLGM